MKEIRINVLDSSSIEAAIKAMKAYERQAKKNAKKVPEEIAKRSAEKARSAYASYVYDWGEQPVTASVSVKHTGSWGNRTSTITASGPEIGFLEFGTGVTYPTWGSSGDAPSPDPPVPARGSFGRHLGRNHTWYYKPWEGVDTTFYTHGMHPAEGMLSAWRFAKENSSNIGREVFRSD